MKLYGKEVINMASIANNYEINVAKKGIKCDVHWCRIEIPYDNKEQAEEKLEFLRNIFGEEFHISMTHWECRGHHEKGWD